MNNKIIGNKFEEDFAEFLSHLRYWVSPFPEKKHTGSQPCDLVAAMNNRIHLIDCKTLNNKNGLFPISRIEENQILAWKKFKECGNDYFSLAILWNNDVYYIAFDEIDFDNKSIDLTHNIPEWSNFYGNRNR